MGADGLPDRINPMHLMIQGIRLIPTCWYPCYTTDMRV